jgi:hypothetical protein
MVPVGSIGQSPRPAGSDHAPAGMARYHGPISEVCLSCCENGMMRLTESSDEYSSYTGETLVPQKSGYMLASTAALRLVPGAKPQPLHRVRS